MTEGESGRPGARSGREPAQPVDVLVGVVGRAHGIKGDATIDVRTDEPDRRFAVGQILRVEDTTQTLRVVSSRLQGGRLVVHFAEFDDRTAVERARGLRLVVDVDPAERPEDPEEYFDRQLVGLTVFAADGREVGPVTAVLHLPVQEVLEIAEGDARHLVPFVSALVPEVDLVAGAIRLADVPGLLDQD